MSLFAGTAILLLIEWRHRLQSVTKQDWIFCNPAFSPTFPPHFWDLKYHSITAVYCTWFLADIRCFFSRWSWNRPLESYHHSSCSVADPPHHTCRITGGSFQSYQSAPLVDGLELYDRYLWLYLSGNIRQTEPSLDRAQRLLAVLQLLDPAASWVSVPLRTERKGTEVWTVQRPVADDGLLWSMLLVVCH